MILLDRVFANHNNTHMALIPWKRDTVVSRLKKAKAELAEIRTKQELEALEGDLADYRRSQTYTRADPSERARMDVEREILREEALSRRSRQSAANRIKARQDLIRIPQEAVSLLTAAKLSAGESVSERSVTVHAQESILEAINGTPYAFDLISEYRQLLQVPTLIRELWPYKPTIIRTIAMLDFVRFLCRVVFEEAPVFKGLVKGKVNYVCRGMKCTVIPKDTEVDPRHDDTAKTAQKYLDMFVDQADYLAKRRERRRRMMIEGEAFLWIEDGNDIETLSPVAQYVEPDYIRPSQRESTNQEDPHLGGQRGEDWSFGIHTPKHRYWQPLGYQIVWNDNEEQKVPASDMIHTAVRERSNIKRCLPPAFCLLDDMIRLTLLRAALADASKFRAGIGGVVQYQEASESAVRSWSETVGGGGSLLRQDVPPRIEEITADSYTNLISLPPGRDFVKGPDYPDINSLQAIYSWHIQAIAQAEQVPEWMVSGAAAGSSFASATTSESSSIIEFEAMQEAECAVDRKVLKRVLTAYIAAGKLPADFFEDYDIGVEGEAMIARDQKSEMETAVMAVEAGFCSRQVAATNLGFDYQRDKPLIDQEREEDDQRQQDLGINPMTGKPDINPDKGGSAQTMSGVKSQQEK